MELDISGAVKQQQQVFPFSLKEDFRNFDYGGDSFVFTKPVLLEGEYCCKADICFINGTISAEMESSCARCLEPVRMNIQVPFSEEFVQKADPDFPERHEMTGNMILLDEIVLADLVLNMPIRVLCNEECKGLCAQCGQNLNIENCDCIKIFNDYQVDDKEV